MTTAPARPLLIFPQPQIVTRPRLRGMGPGFHRPPPARQQERLAPQFAALEQAFAAEQARLAQSAPGAVPEQVLVLETVGPIPEFLKAVKGIPGMEWLGAWDEEDLEPDDDFYQDDTHRDALLGGQLLLILNNQQALQELRALWDRYRTDPDGRWGRGRTKWRDLFNHLRTIRPWNAQDRLHNTGLFEEWQRRVAANAERVRIEAELWFRADQADQERSEARFEECLRAESGTLISRSVLPEIAYHGILAELPIGAVGAMVQHQDTEVVRCEQVMFFRPTGQVVGIVPQDTSPTNRPLPAGLALPSGVPVAALLDGLPQANHQWLAGRLRIDDPDGWAAAYRAQEQQHGTAMASLIVHGDLDAHEPPLSRPLYVRPILKPNPSDFRQVRDECIPEDTLTVDLIHRAVRRLFERTGTEQPAALSVRVVDLSVGDPSRPFDRFPSPWARLLDWLSWQHKVLFVVSAGNYDQDLELNVPAHDLRQLSASDLEVETLRAIATSAEKRTIIAPSEAINALTVGALHADSSLVTVMGNRRDLLASPGVPSPISRMGPGFKRAIKPEVLAPGGRQAYQNPVGSAGNLTFRLSKATGAPGQAVAVPGPTPGNVTAVQYMRGTSNAAALTTRTAALLFEVLQTLRQQPEGALLYDRYTAVLLKALLAHSARWGPGADTLKRALSTGQHGKHRRQLLARFLGYGPLDAPRVFACTDQRVTLLGCGEFDANGAHRYSLALPPSLAGRKEFRRLTITLAWLTHVHAGHNIYRRVALWVDPLTAADILKVTRSDADWQAAQRGTLQHEVLEGAKATPYGDDDRIELLVSCRCLTKPLRLEMVPYALAVTLEVAEGTAIPIYDEVSARIRPTAPVRVPVTGSAGPDKGQ